MVHRRSRDMRVRQIADRLGMLDPRDDVASGPGTVVYLCRDEQTGTVLYVGITSSFNQRRTAHRARSWWTPTTRMVIDSEHELRADAETRERVLIEELAPLYNVQHADPVRTVERAREQWAQVTYDERTVDVVFAIADAKTWEDFQRCQRYARRCLFELLPAEDKRRINAAGKAKQREARRQQAVADSGERWLTVDQLAELGDAYNKSRLLAGLRSGGLAGQKFEGIWHTTPDRVDAWFEAMAHAAKS